MRYLTRRELLDRTLEPDDLTALARLWVSWYDGCCQSAAGSGAPVSPPLFRLEARLWGFPREDGELVRQMVDARLEALGIAVGAPVRLVDPDTLSVTLADIDAGAGPLPDLSRWHLLFADPIFDHRTVEYRLAAQGRSGARTPVRGNTLGLFGVIERGRFWLKALFPLDDETPSEEKLIRYNAWQHEAALLGIAYDLRTTGQMPGAPSWASTVFSPPAAASLNRLLSWYLVPKDHKLGGFLLRAGIGAAAAASGAGLIASGAAASSTLGLGIGLPVAAAGLLGLGYTGRRGIHRVTRFHRRMGEARRRIYSRSVDYPEVDLSREPGALEDPSVRKFSRDIEALGGVHFRDITIEPPLESRSVIRLYLLPEDRTVLTLMLMRGTGTLRLFPARPICMARTYLADGWRVYSTNGISGYARPLPLPVIGRRFPEAAHPSDLVARHREVLRGLASQGRAAAPLEPERVVERMVEEHRETGALLAKRGYYGWDDAFCQAFEITRPEYRA